MKKKIIIKIFLIALIILLTSATTVYAVLSIESSSVSYDNTTTSLPNTVQGAIDELYDRQSTLYSKIQFWEYLKYTLPNSSSIIQDDETEDHNMRYTGNSPNNYVTFENEEWRVIGVFNNIDDGTGKKEPRVKIIKNLTLGRIQWDETGSNDWLRPSTLQTKLNDNTFSYSSNEMIDNAVWYVNKIDSSNYTASEIYSKEREESITWTGKVGLIYPSDYGFASSSCYNGNQTLVNYKSGCRTTDWLFKTLIWTITGNSLTNNSVGSVDGGTSLGGLNLGYAVTQNREVYPTVYLKSNTICTNCNEADAGTSGNPFEISLPQT